MLDYFTHSQLIRTSQQKRFLRATPSLDICKRLRIPSAAHPQGSLSELHGVTHGTMSLKRSM